MAEHEFRVLLAAHVAGDPAEATVVLAAAAAFSGLQADGTAMRGLGAPASLRDIAAELGLHVGAVRRGVQWLQAAGLVTVGGAGVCVCATALQARWAARSCVVRLSREVRSLQLRSEPLLVAGVVAGHVDEHNQFVCGLARWVARTGLQRRTVMRAMDTAEAAGAMHRWALPGTVAGRSGVLCCAAGPRRVLSPEAKRELSPPPVAFCHRERRELSPPPSRSVTRRTGSDRSTEQTRRRETRDGRVPAAEPETREPWHGLRRLLLSTRVREGLTDPLERWQFADTLARALHGQGMTEADCAELYAIAQRETDRDDPTGLFFTLLNGPWRRTLDDERARQRHDGLQRRAARAATAPWPAREPQSIGEQLEELLRRVRHG